MLCCTPRYIACPKHTCHLRLQASICLIRWGVNLKCTLHFRLVLQETFDMLHPQRGFKAKAPNALKNMALEWWFQEQQFHTIKCMQANVALWQIIVHEHITTLWEIANTYIQTYPYAQTSSSAGANAKAKYRHLAYNRTQAPWMMQK